MIRAGEQLATIEAIEMENILVAVRDGVVANVRAGNGEGLAVEQIIIEPNRCACRAGLRRLGDEYRLRARKSPTPVRYRFTHGKIPFTNLDDAGIALIMPTSPRATCLFKQA